MSPDGTKLAFTVDSSSHVGHESPGYSDEIIAIDLRTGEQEVWMGGLYRSGEQFSILDVSWTADGRSLVFLGQWCDAVASPRCDGTSAPGGYRDAQVWSLSLAAGGGSLSDGQPLLRQSARYPVIAQALGGPDGSDLTLAVLSGRRTETASGCSSPSSRSRRMDPREASTTGSRELRGSAGRPGRSG